MVLIKLLVVRLRNTLGGEGGGGRRRKGKSPLHFNTTCLKYLTVVIYPVLKSMYKLLLIKILVINLKKLEEYFRSSSYEKTLTCKANLKKIL